MPHIADHFRFGWTIDTSRPTFAVFRHMHDNGCISAEDYAHCMNYTERPFVDGLRPADYIPREIIEKEEIAWQRDNRVIVTETREEKRRRRAMQKGSRQHGEGSSVKYGQSD